MRTVIAVVAAVALASCGKAPVVCSAISDKQADKDYQKSIHDDPKHAGAAASAKADWCEERAANRLASQTNEPAEVLATVIVHECSTPITIARDETRADTIREFGPSAPDEAAQNREFDHDIHDAALSYVAEVRASHCTKTEEVGT